MANVPAAAPVPAPSPAAAAAAANTALLGRIRPTLSELDKQGARAQSAALRGHKAGVPRAAAASGAAIAPATAPATVYAVATRPSAQREVASAGLAVMNPASGRLLPPVPEHVELVQTQGRWHAAWWPFANLADAECARVLLTGKGLKVELVEF